MITLISFLLAVTGCINWLSIAVLQYDFVAGIFGSQANIFSRIVYGIIGLAALILVYAAIKNKGRIMATGRRASDRELAFKKKPKKAQEYADNDKMYNNNDKKELSHGAYSQDDKNYDDRRYEREMKHNDVYNHDDKYDDNKY